MIALLALAIGTNQRIVRYDLGKSDGLVLSVDLKLESTYMDPFRDTTYHAHFFAKDKNGRIVDEKFVDLGADTDDPESLVVEDRFHQGYKQFFISLHQGRTASYLFAFRNRKFYTAYICEHGRVNVSVAKGKAGTWKLEESWWKWGRIRPGQDQEKIPVEATVILTPSSKPAVR